MSELPAQPETGLKATAAAASVAGAAPVSYATAGVDIDAGDRAVELMKDKVAATRRPEVVGGLGGFAGLFAADFGRFRRPLLASSADGVGTKLTLAQAMDRHDTVGHDLIGMLVDDLVVCGAEPLFVLDYIACGKVVPERIADIVGGIADGCRLAGAALIGGETAEHPGVMPPGDYDLAGTAIGVVDADEVLGAERLQLGDVVVALGSSGIHSNGFSLVRHVFFGGMRPGEAGLPLDAVLPELAAPLGEVLLTPTRIYALDCLAMIRHGGVHAFAHITGGGLAGNLVRVLPPTLTAVVERGSWTPAPIFAAIARHGGVPQPELERAFNMGTGMVAVVAADAADAAVQLMRSRGLDAWIAGQIVPGDGTVRMVGDYAGW